MIPSCEAVAENIKKHCEAVAHEISARCTTLTDIERVIVEREARGVLLDWLLGDWLPPHKDPIDADERTA